MDIFATIVSAGVPVNGLVDDPEIRITDDTGTIVQAFVAMTDLGQDGKHLFAYTIPDTARSYTFLVDADPNVTGQVAGNDRYYFGSFGGEDDIVATSADLANLDAPVSSRATQAQILSDATPFPGANVDVAISTRNSVVPLDAATDAAAHLATQGAIAALNNISIADVQTALTNQGYTAARALLLDNLDAAITTRATQADILSDATPFPGANIDAAISSRAAPGAAMSLTGATLTAIQGLILSDATPFQGADIAAILTAVTALDSFIQGGREIDFVGDDAAGWQRVERDVGGTIIRRYDLFDETDTRIDETVASFIGRQGMISRETISP